MITLHERVGKNNNQKTKKVQVVSVLPVVASSRHQ